MSCGCGKKKCNGKCGISPSVLQINNNECTLFHKVEIPAVMGDETTNPPKTGAYRNVLLYYEASGNSYLYSSDGIPTKLTGVVSDYEVLTNKPSINGVVLIKNKTLADLGIISAIDSAVADEATARENADNALSDRITTNTNNIAANATAISNEATARTNADNTLSARISGNTTAINNEKTARENADTALSNRITANANAISAETTARENADNALSGRITANADSISGEKTARENADAGLQDQITAVKATADSAVQPDDINKTVMSDLAVDSNSSTAQVILKESKVNLKTGATSSEQTSLPVASSSQAGVMNSATYDAVTSNTSNINAIMNGAVAITGLSANPSQSDLTTAWQNETGLSTLINRASVYDVTNNKVWTYYTNDTTWHAASNTSQVTVNTFTNSSEGTIKGSTNIGQVFAENDGTGSVNGWDALSSDVANAKSKLSGIQSGAEVNVQSDWNVSDSSSDAYIKNKPTIGNGTLTIQKNGTTIDTFTANSTTNKTVNITVPTVNDATLTIQKNGDTVQTFTANSSSNKTANIEVPTKTSELDNDAGFIANDTHQVCGEGGNITLDTTTFEPLEMNHLGGNTEQQTYTGKNLYNDSTARHVYLNANGSEDSNIVWLTSTFIAVRGSTTYTWSGSIKTGQTKPQILIAEFDSSQNIILGTHHQYNDTSSKSFTTTATTAYVKVCYNSERQEKMQLEIGSTATTFEPYVGGTASPNPDYPQAVQTVTGENVVKICGKNLYDGEISATNQRLSTSTGGGYSSQGWDISSYVSVQPNTTYTINTQDRIFCDEYAIDKTFIKGTAQTYGLTDPITITTTSTTRFIRFDFPTGNASVSMLELGSTATAYEPYQGQSYEIDLASKNLFDVSKAQDYKWLSAGTGWIIDSSDPNIVSDYIHVEVGKTYVISGIGGFQWNLFSFEYPGAYGTREIANSTTIRTYTATTEWLRFSIGGGNAIAIKGDIQLEKGSTPTTYADYFTPIELCKIGTYQDYIWKDGDTWKVHKAVGSHTFIGDSSEVWNGGGAGTASTDYTYIYTSYLDSVAKRGVALICDKMIGITGEIYRSTSVTSDTIGIMNTSGNDAIRVFVLTSRLSASTSAAWETWLASNPITVYYALATPTDTEITNETLIAQLNALWEADGYDSQTNITLTYTEGNAQGILSVCQYPSHLPIATKSKLGTIIVGHGLDIEDDGRLDVIVDSALSDSSINPVQNKAITTELNSKADISSVPTKTSQLENDSGFVVNDTTEICDEGSDMTLNGTLLEPLDVKKIEGETSQQTYTGKNLINLTGVTSPSGVTGTITDGSTIKVTGTTGTNVSDNKVANLSSTIPAGTYTFTIDHAANHVINFRVDTSGGEVAFRLAPGETSVTKTLASASTAGQVFWGLLANTTYNETFKFQLVAGSTADYDFEPYVGGVSAPNPDYPQAVNTVTGRQMVKVEGKNLLNIQDNIKASDDGLTFSYQNGAITASGAASPNSYANVTNVIDTWLQAGAYTLSISSALTHRVYLWVRYSDGTTGALPIINAGNTSAQATFAKDVIQMRLDFSSMTIGAAINETFSVQLEKGSTATAYEPYQGQSYEVNLGDIELSKIGDCQDYIYKSGDKWYVHKVINKYTTTGSENWTQYQAGFYYATNVFATPVMKRVACYCDTLKGFAASDTISTFISDSSDTSYATNTHTTQGLLRIKNIDMASLADFKTWLAANPTTVYYPLATPTDTEITNEALVAQLEALWEADGIEGETNIFTASDGVNERAILSVCQYPSHLPIATKTKLGTVVVGHGLDIEADGKLDVIVDDDFSTESDHPIQNKVITNALAGKADNTDLSTVAMTGSYDDLTGKPTIPTVNNATLTIQKNGTDVATFTANSSTNVTANITTPVVTMTTTDPGEGGALAANNFIGVYV